MKTHFSLDELQRVKQWHVRHKRQRPLEYHLFDAVLTLWLMGWVGWVPLVALALPWCAPLCVLGMALPALYIQWRAQAHAHGMLRCDWAALVLPVPARGGLHR